MERDPMEMALSTDIVLDIVLGHLKVRDLLSCRLASKFWNRISSSVLRKRSTVIKSISDEEELMELEACMEESWDFPFAGLKFNQPWQLNSSDAMEFFKNYGARFTSLCLNTELKIRLPCPAPFIKHFPRLSILEVGHLYGFYDLDSVARQEDGQVLDLSSVQTLRIRISSPCNGVDENIVCEVLAAVSPSVQIECQYATPEILRALKRTGRLQAATFMKFDKDTRFGFDMDFVYARRQLEMDQLLTESISLTKLDFTARKWLSMIGLLNILRSSQQTLTEFHFGGKCPSEFSWDNLPVLTKLATFSSRTGSDFWPGSLFRGRHGHKFPALKKLKLRITDKGKVNCFTDDLFVVPSVTVIDLEGHVDSGGIKALARIFPNVIEMRLDYSYYSGESELRNPFQIWSVRDFKYLEKLRIWNFDVKRPSKSYINMDSFLTGMHVEICENLRSADQLNLVTSPFNKILRVHPNILQLRNLRELVVCVKRGSRSKLRPQDTPFISMVSVWYALEMMPKLEAKFVYENPSEPSYKDKRDKAVLEAAFGHVKEYVPLGPFFY